MLGRTLTGLASLALLCLPACQADTSGGGTGVDEDNAAEEAAKIICAAYYDCDCSSAMYSSQENCELELAADLQASIDRAKEDGDLHYDSSCIPKFEAGIDAMGCNSLWGVYLSDISVAVAELGECNLYYGDKGDGEACTVLPDTGIHDCDQGMDCDMSGQCVAPLAEGDSCAGGAQATPCGGGTVCVSIQGDQNTTCEFLPSAGQTCLGVLDLCATDSYCDQDTKKCASLPVSGDCAAMANPLSGRTCAFGKTCDAGTCTDAPAPGDTCGADDNACAEDSWCGGGGTCEEQDPYVCLLPYCIQFPGAC